MTTEEIFSAFYGPYQENRTFYHGHTFTGNPMAAAAALACLEVFEQEKTLENVAGTAAYLQRAVQEFHELDRVGDIRCIGTIAAMELVRDKTSKAPFTFEERVGWPIYLAGLEKGVILRPLGNVVYLWLPLTVTPADIDEILARTRDVLSNPALYPTA